MCTHHWAPSLSHTHQPLVATVLLSISMNHAIFAVLCLVCFIYIMTSNSFIHISNMLQLVSEFHSFTNIHLICFQLLAAMKMLLCTLMHRYFSPCLHFFFCINAWRWNCWMTWKFCDQLFEESHFNAISLYNIKQWILIKKI